jgi:hypothetical protein
MTAHTYNLAHITAALTPPTLDSPPIARNCGIIRPSGDTIHSSFLAAASGQSSLTLPDFLDVALQCLLKDGSITLTL